MDASNNDYEPLENLSEIDEPDVPPKVTPQFNRKEGRLSFALCDDIAHYSGLASWVFLSLFILGAFIDQPVVQVIGMFGTIFTIAVSMFFDELAARKIGEGHGLAGTIVLVCVGCAVAVSIGSYIAGKPEVVAGGVFALLILSFVPAVIDRFMPSRENEERYRPVASQMSGYSEFGEIFGVHTPKPPPPIEIEKGENLNDDWEEYLGIEVPDIENLRNERHAMMKPSTSKLAIEHSVDTSEESAELQETESDEEESPVEQVVQVEAVEESEEVEEGKQIEGQGDAVVSSEKTADIVVEAEEKEE